jgi:DNA-binding ferritin-like protein (Dps family)
MRNLLTKVLGDRREWRALEARARALPREHRIVYGEIQRYLWKLTAGSGRDTVAVLRDLLDLFETAAVDGTGALAVTGEDVAAFADELLRGATSYTQRWREDLNRDVQRKLRGEEP